jgi:hypothetical protein
MLQGTVDGNADTLVGGLSKIEEGKPGTLTFLANPKYTEHIYTTGASIAIVATDFKAEKPLPSSLTQNCLRRITSCVNPNLLSVIRHISNLLHKWERVSTWVSLFT